MDIENTETFEYFNPNPLFTTMKNGKVKFWDRGDCSVRAVCGATGLSWVDAYKQMSESALKVYECFNCDYGFDQVMKDLGFTKHSLGRLSKGTKRPTVREFAKDHKNEICIVHPANHYVCVKNGKVYDTWDCGSTKVYSWWTKDVNTK